MSKILLAALLALPCLARASFVSFDCETPNAYAAALIADVSTTVAMLVPQLSTVPLGVVGLDKARPMSSAAESALEVVRPGVHGCATFDTVGGSITAFHGQIAAGLSPRILVNLVLHRVCLEWRDAPPAVAAR